MRNVFKFWLNVSSALLMVTMAVTGLLIHFVLPPGTGGRGRGAALTVLGWSRHDWGELHLWIGVGLIGLVLVHVWLNWSWVACMAARLLDNPKPGQRQQVLAGACILTAFVAISGGFLWWANSAVARDISVGNAQSGHHHGRMAKRRGREGGFGFGSTGLRCQHGFHGRDDAIVTRPSR
ncbi:DUF4405 domain-containing protein [Myxococcota bacterium]